LDDPWALKPTAQQCDESAQLIEKIWSSRFVPVGAAACFQAELAASLAQTAAQDPDTEVQLRADQAVPYGRVVQVMGAAQQAGLNRIGFVADPPKTPAR